MGNASQIGYAKESTWGTPVTVTRFIPVLASSLTKEIESTKSAAVYGGRRVRTPALEARTNVTVGGDVQHEVYDESIGLLLEAMFGGVQTTGAGPYTHTFTPGALPSLTVQEGLDANDATIYPFTFEGMKVSEWELAAAVGEVATLGVTMVGEDMLTATSLETASYDAGLTPLVFTNGHVQVDDADVCANSITITGSNSLKDDRRCIGGGGLINEPVEVAGYRDYMATVEVEFADLTEYNLFLNATIAELELQLTDGATHSLTVTMNGRFTGSKPVLAAADLTPQTLTFEAMSATSDADAITAVLINDDSAP